jgi:hypothetical protein
MLSSAPNFLLELANFAPSSAHRRKRRGAPNGALPLDRRRPDSWLEPGENELSATYQVLMNSHYS